jgi:site-specific DNA recombinase
MNRITQQESERRLRKMRRRQLRKFKRCAFTIFWVALVVTGLVMPCQAGQQLFNPALLGMMAHISPARRRRNGRQPNQAAASYSRFSSSLQDDTSIDTQQDRCNQQAVTDGLPIDEQLQYADKAVSGTKLHRDALDKLLADAEAGRFRRMYFFSLSRLARESVIGLALIKRLVYVYKIRVISVTEGLDSDREGWETLAQILFMQHERYVKELSENTFRGQKGNIANRFSNGDFCFGYSTEPVPGTETTRRGRHRKPRMRYVIDPAEAEWVRRIFHWYVVERRSLRWITRELNRLKAPKDHRSNTPNWHHQMLARLIANIKLIGLWPWGRMKNERDPETGLISQDARPAEEAQQWLRNFPELRIISDEQFFKAQEILAKNAEQNAKGRSEKGEFTAEQGEASLTTPLHLLAGLVVCGACGRKFYVGGARGKYLFCPGYADGTCSCRTMLRRDLAERLLLELIGQRILNDAAWLQHVLDCTLAAWERFQATVPNELRDTETALADVNRRIQRMLDHMEGQQLVEPDVQQRIAERRAERHELESKLERLRQSVQCAPSRPTAKWVAQQMQHLHEVLASGTPAAAHALRGLTGGSIVVEEVQTDGRKRRHLRCQFRL